MTTKNNLKQFFEESSTFITCVKTGDFLQDNLYEIHLEILKIDGKKLEMIEPERFTADQYFNLCSAAIDQNGLAIQWVDVSIIGAELYQKLCCQAVKQNGIALYYVKKEHFQNDQKKLRVIYNIAVSQNNDALQLIQDQTFELCLMAVKHPSALQWVRASILSKEDYGKICFAAFYQKRPLAVIERIFGGFPEIKHIQNYQALRFVNKEHLSPEKYKEICLLAIQYSSESLPFVDEALWLDNDFCLEAVKLSKKSENYVKNH
ncbi:hypothetical protein FACS1894130_03190 [Spirochaetia bacterium]|nr:hypothetical protein FACS1894130_03190 [Spirochaetia bacterium]